MPIIDGLLCISKELALVKPSRRKHPQIQTSWKKSLENFSYWDISKQQDSHTMTLVPFNNANRLLMCSWEHFPNIFSHCFKNAHFFLGP